MNLTKKFAQLGLAFGLITAVFLLANRQPNNLAAQTSSDEIIIEDFANGFFPPRLNNFFNHTFSLGTAWDLSGAGVGDPISQSPPFALRLFAGNEDRITFNQAARAYVSEAEIWGFAPSDLDGSNMGRGRVVFEGQHDSKTFNFNGRIRHWQQFQASETTVGDSGNALGGIVAIRLMDVGNNGYAPMFDDLGVVSTTPPYRTDLALAMSGPVSPVLPGDRLTYQLTVTNNGPEIAPEVLIENVAPFGGIFIEATSDPQCEEEVEGVGICRLGTLPVGGSRTIAVGIEVSNNICNTFSNRATVTFAGLDVAPANNVAAVSNTTPNPICADLRVTHTAAPQPPFADEDFSYFITAVNWGTDPAGATLTHTLPAEVTLRDILPGDGVIGCTSSGQVITCDLGTMPVRNPKEVEVVVYSDTSFDGILRSETAVTGTLFDPLPNNNSHVHRFSLGARYDFTIIGTVGEGALARYDRLDSIDLNYNGQVAFLVTGPNQINNFGIFRGDGETLTQLATEETIEPPLEGEIHIISGAKEISQNDLGQVAFAVQTVSIEPGTGFIATALYVTNEEDEPEQLIARRYQSEPSGERLLFEYSILLNNRGELTTTFRNFPRQESILVRYDENGERIFTYALPDLNNSFFGIAESRQGIMYAERKGSLGFETDYYVFFHNANRPRLLQSFNFNYQLNQNQFNLAYNDRGYHVHRALIPDRTTNTARLGLYGGYVPPYQPLVELLVPLGSNQDYLGYPTINNFDEFVYYCRRNICHEGLYTGPPSAATSVVRHNSTQIDGSTIDSFLGSGNEIIINDRGQIAFAVLLTDGRQVIVRADPTRDSDEDGRSDVEESNGPRNGDGNFDGINDGSQLHVATFRNSENGQYVTFETDDQARLRNVRSVSNPDRDTAPANVFFPIGHFQFEVTDIQPGSATTVTLYTNSVIQSWWKYGPTPDNPTPHWYDFTYDGETGAQILAGRVVLHFVDGERGDSDLTANGIILDPGAPSGFPHNLYLPYINR